jgi:serine/threonine-protein kinase
LPRLQQEFPLPRALAKELMRREWLTAYQANQIFLGRADDLFVSQYLCLKKIGEGGMGQVFKARKRPLDRIVALKVLRRECLENSKTVQRFQREMRFVGQLQHPHIVRALDADEAGGAHYIAMEYIDGYDLARMVKRQGPLPIEPALDYIRQAALGLQHAHDCGLVHRDIKPANLLVAKDSALTRPRSGETFRWGMAKILDLGLARLTDPREASLTVHGTVMGTPDFIAPEQALNPRTCDARADLYSLGCTLFYILTGRIPFPRGGVAEKLLQHQMHDAESIASVRSARLVHDAAKTGVRADEAHFHVPDDVETLVRILMAKRPDQRFQTATQVAQTIECLLARFDGDPMAITLSPSLTHPSLHLAQQTPPLSLPAPATMPMTEFFVPRPPSAPWRAMVCGSRPDAIVKIQAPEPVKSSPSRWWFVGATVAMVLSTALFIQGNRALKTQAEDASPKVEKR